MNNQTADKSQTMVELFKNYFSVVFANTRELKELAYRIRYNVYCEEFKFESLENCPNKMEQDEYDELALHGLIIHKNTNIPAACVRLVPAIGDGHDIQLPFEKYCAESLDRSLIESFNLERQTECEISRLAVDGLFRKRNGESLTRFGDINLDFSKEEQRTFLLIAVAAFLAATAMTILSGKTNVFAMMEPFLPRLLKRSGIIFERVGKDIDYHGIRAPYFGTTQSAIDNMRPELLELYHWVYEQIASTYQTE